MALQYDFNLPLFSLHVPKTGGSTLYSLLPLWMEPGHVLPHYRRRKLGVPPRKYLDLGPHDVLHGHFVNGNRTGLFDYYPDAKQCIAFVRNPFDQLVSHYFEDRMRVLHGGSNDWPTWFPTFESFYQHQMDLLRAFVRNPFDQLVSHYFEDRMRVLHGGSNDWPTWFPTFESFYQHQMDLLKSGSGSVVLNCLPRGISLDNYREFIDRLFVHLGFFESFTESLTILGRKLAAPVTQHAIPRLRSPERDQEIPAQLRERYLNEHPLPLDHCLWEYARELHARDLHCI